MRKLGSIFLIFLIIYTTIGVRVNEHFCIEKNITSYTLFQPKNCCHQKEQTCLHQHKIKDCCVDKVNFIHLGQDIHFSPNETTPNQNLIAFANFRSIIESTLINRLQPKKIKSRAPPLLFTKKNILALHQVFII